MDIEKSERGNVKPGFCTTNACSCLFCVLVVAAIAAVAVVTFVVPGLRSPIIREAQGSNLKWWQTSIIYQIYPRSFQDTDGDGVGDLEGITSRLSYFNTLGVEAIWLSPFYRSAMRDFGYDVINYTEIDPLFGNMADFDRLVKEAHEKGMKVIVDFVPNHTSNESTWFDLSRRRQGKYTDYYMWSDGIVNGQHREPPNNWQSTFEGPAWTWDDTRGQYYYHAFLDSQPDLKFSNVHVREEMNTVLRFWCRKGVDGFRIDAVPYLFEKSNLSYNEPKVVNNFFDVSLHKYTKNQPEVFDIVREWRRVLDEFEAKDGESRFLLAETVGIPYADRMRYYEAGSVPFFFKLIPAKSTCQATAQCILDIIKDGTNLTDGQWPNFVIGNHDNSRVASNLGRAYGDAMNMMLLTLPGTPTTYYGEELGLTNGDYTGQQPKDPYALTSGDSSKSRDPERNPMQWNTSINAGFTSGTPWLGVNPDYMTYSVQAEAASNTSSLSIYRALAAIRKRPAFQSTNIVFPETTTDAVVYIRSDGVEEYAVALNLDTNDVTLNLQLSNHKTGTIQVSTKPRPSKTVDLSSVHLREGEGLIILLS